MIFITLCGTGRLGNALYFYNGMKRLLCDNDRLIDLNLIKHTNGIYATPQRRLHKRYLTNIMFRYFVKFLSFFFKKYKDKIHDIKLFKIYFLAFGNDEMLSCDRFHLLRKQGIKICFVCGGWKIDNEKSYLSPAKYFESDKKLQNYFMKLRGKSSNDKLIGVHVRRGDFRIWRGGKYFMDFTESIEFVVRDLKLNSMHDNFTILLFSDEQLSTEEKFSVEVIQSSGTPSEDLYSLSRCDYIYGSSISSFCRFAALWAGKPLNVIN